MRCRATLDIGVQRVKKRYVSTDLQSCATGVDDRNARCTGVSTIKIPIARPKAKEKQVSIIRCTATARLTLDPASSPLSFNGYYTKREKIDRVDLRIILLIFPIRGIFVTCTCGTYY